METKDELLSEGEKYFEKVMQDFNQNRKGRNLRKYCNDEGIDYKWLSEYKRTYGATKAASAAKNSATDGISFTALDVIESKMTPEDPRKESGWTVKQIIICSPEGEELELRSDNLLILQKWFDDGKLMKPKFMEMKRFHHITREQAMFLLSNAVQSEIYIYDNDKYDQRAGGGI